MHNQDLMEPVLNTWLFHNRIDLYLLKESPMESNNSSSTFTSAVSPFEIFRKSRSNAGVARTRN